VEDSSDGRLDSTTSASALEDIEELLDDEHDSCVDNGVGRKWT